jgi:hypothetical protein
MNTGLCSGLDGSGNRGSSLIMNFRDSYLGPSALISSWPQGNPVRYWCLVLCQTGDHEGLAVSELLLDIRDYISCSQ